MRRRIPAICVLLLCAAALAAPGPARSQWPYDERSLAPFVPSPQEVVDKMLEMAGVKKDDMVYDLGCGDGRIIITAAQKFGAHATGVELDPELFKKTQEHIHRLKLDGQVKVIHGNLLDIDLSPATVVTLYLLTASNSKVKPNLEKYLRPGARVVSHDFEVKGWTPVKVEKITQNSRTHTIYLYEIARNK
jgi:ubiquinone/menaquinone biosynthesis C-methylase UbiE